MARYWQPKHKCICSACGWTGKRTALGILTIPCPACWPHHKSRQEKIRHIIAIGKNWQTIRKLND